MFGDTLLVWSTEFGRSIPSARAQQAATIMAERSSTGSWAQALREA